MNNLGKSSSSVRYSGNELLKVLSDNWLQQKAVLLKFKLEGLGFRLKHITFLSEEPKALVIDRKLAIYKPWQNVRKNLNRKPSFLEKLFPSLRVKREFIAYYPDEKKYIILSFV